VPTGVLERVPGEVAISGATYAGLLPLPAPRAGRGSDRVCGTVVHQHHRNASRLLKRLDHPMNRYPRARSHRYQHRGAGAALYGVPYGPSIAKEDRSHPGHYRAFIEAAPFFALASGGPEGMDCSPRGDAPGFVRVADEKTLLIPDRRGNNRNRYITQHPA